MKWNEWVFFKIIEAKKNEEKSKTLPTPVVEIELLEIYKFLNLVWLIWMEFNTIKNIRQQRINLLFALRWGEIRQQQQQQKM